MLPGQYWDAETNLHYNRFRYYDPSTGRYVTSDPIGLAGGLNTYGYVGGNPVGLVDPYGLVCPNCATGAIGAIIGAVSGGINAAARGGSFKQVAQAAGIGAAGGFIAGFTLGAGTPATIATGGLSGLGGSISGSYLTGNGPPSPESATVSALAGMTGGLYSSFLFTSGLPASTSLIGGSAVTGGLELSGQFLNNEYLLDSNLLFSPLSDSYIDNNGTCLVR